MRIILRHFAFFLSMSVLVLIFQNCSQSDFVKEALLGHYDGTSLGNDLRNPIEGPEFRVPSDLGIRVSGAFDNNCLNNPNYNACLFYKNPVASNKQTIPGGLDDTTPLGSMGFQNFGVNIQVNSPTGLLETNTIAVFPQFEAPSDFNNPVPFDDGSADIQDAQPNNQGNWKYPFEGLGGNGDPNQFVAQITAYYWLTEQEKFVQSNMGTQLTQGTIFIIDTYHRHPASSDLAAINNAFFTPVGLQDGTEAGLIVMGRRETQTTQHDIALSAEVFSHEACHGLMYFSTRGESFPPTPGADPNAGQNASFCSSSNGCVRAIDEGQADFCFGVMFPDSPTVGETWVNNFAGFNGRNIESNSGFTAQQIFTNSQGEIHGVGTLYASMWWEVWKKALPMGLHDEMEQLFSQHLLSLSYRDNFGTALTAITAIVDVQYPNSGLSQMFRQEWARRGL